MDWLKCNICFNTYNDSDLRPRSLICGHTFCEKCLDNTIQNNTLTCPQCRKILEINSVVDLPINFVLEGLLKSLIPCSQDINEGATSRPSEGEVVPNDKDEPYSSLKSILEQEQKSFSAQKELLKTSAGMCNEHSGNELVFRCSSHRSWVCEKCVEQRGDHPRDNCVIISFKEEIENRKQEHNISLDNQEKSCDETVFVIQKHISYLSEKREHHSSLVDALQDLVTLHKNEDKNLESEITSFEKFIENGKAVKQRLLNVKEAVLNAETLDESNVARDMVEINKSEAVNWVKKSVSEVDEGKIKVQTSTNIEVATRKSLEYRETCRLSQEELDTNINKLEKSEPLEKLINSTNNEVIEKDDSRISNAIYDDVCKAHNKSIEHRCLKCQRWLCGNCLKFHTTLTGCSTINSFAAVENIKEKDIESIDWILSIFRINSNCLKIKIQEHNEIIQQIDAKKKELSDQAENHAKEVGKLQIVLDQAKEIKENVGNAIENLDSTDSPNAVCDLIEILAEKRQELCTWTITNLGITIPHDIHDIAKSLEENKNVYVECINKMEKKHGKLSLHNGELYFHKFLKQKIEDGSTLIPIHRLLNLYPSFTHTMFIELSYREVVKGKIVVQLDKKLPNIKENIIKIVTAQLDNSLVGAKCNQDYNSLSCRPSNTSSYNLLFKPDNGPSNAKKGDLVACYSFGALQELFFHVDDYNRDNNFLSYSYRVVGSIIKGLEIVQECYYKHNNKIMITDCGLVLPLE